ncbi:GTP cyclohydrolase 1 feedback regulatory protein-like [Corticium candelabrum]|uniref:GTP cyclohydrolase 1 feedback regulatory protein-like n=1 Tax=Corticium candelabrum TaxID=121492 RepID=UPI002E261FD1|nr:GTP cyclohydrolase 1 feedback regulatory protein-like [Corticium candelabrum]
MPYVLISTQIRLTSGPTCCGDKDADPKLMARLDAKLVKEFGNSFEEYRCDDPPRLVLNKLEKEGYRIVSSAGIGQTIVWTLYKPDD